MKRSNLSLLALLYWFQSRGAVSQEVNPRPPAYGTILAYCPSTRRLCARVNVCLGFNMPFLLQGVLKIAAYLVTQQQQSVVMKQL